VGQGLLIGFAPVAAPANRLAPFIENHRRHRDFSGLAHQRSPAQQPLHPQAIALAIARV